MKARIIAGAAVLAALVLAGCSVQDSSEPSPPVAPSAESSHPAPQDDLDYELAPYPTWDAHSRLEAMDVARAAVAAYGRGGADDWWEQLEPLLNDEAARTYANVRATEADRFQPTGDATITDDDSAYVAVVEVPSTVGVFAVTVARDGADEDWKVSRFTFPEGTG